MEQYRFREALAAAMDMVRPGNKLLTDFGALENIQI